MIDFPNISHISIDDSKRLEKSFFAPPGKKYNQNRKNKKFIALTVSLASVIAVLLAIFLINFNIVIIPQYKNNFKPETINLLNKNATSAIKLINPQSASRVMKGIIYINIPFNTKTGFSITLKDKMDMSNSRIILLIKRTRKEFRLDTILRDINFFSNSGKPLETKILKPNDRSPPYMKISIMINDKTKSTLNLKLINQLRFIFYQAKVDSLPLLIKDIRIEKRR